jgi:hypothetical protein
MLAMAGSASPSAAGHLAEFDLPRGIAALVIAPGHSKP